MGVCCRLGECCPPDRQAKALAAHLDIPEDAALKIAEGFILVPRDLEAGAMAHVKTTLRAYLRARGHAVEEEDA